MRLMRSRRSRAGSACERRSTSVGCPRSQRSGRSWFAGATALTRERLADGARGSAAEPHLAVAQELGRLRGVIPEREVVEHRRRHRSPGSIATSGAAADVAAATKIRSHDRGAFGSEAISARPPAPVRRRLPRADRLPARARRGPRSRGDAGAPAGRTVRAVTGALANCMISCDRQVIRRGYWPSCQATTSKEMSSSTMVGPRFGHSRKITETGSISRRTAPLGGASGHETTHAGT